MFSWLKWGLLGLGIILVPGMLLLSAVVFFYNKMFGVE